MQRGSHVHEKREILSGLFGQKPDSFRRMKRIEEFTKYSVFANGPVFLAKVSIFRGLNLPSKV
jgi:hypothetical protein